MRPRGSSPDEVLPPHYYYNINLLAIAFSQPRDIAVTSNKTIDEDYCDSTIEAFAAQFGCWSRHRYKSYKLIINKR